MAFLPAFSAPNCLITIWLFLNGLHYKKKSIDPTPASKVATVTNPKQGFPIVLGRLAWFIVNFPGFVHVCWLLATGWDAMSGLRLLVTLLLLVHFSKRLFEVLFVQSFSVGQNMFVSMIPGMLYCLNNWIWLRSIDEELLGVVGQTRALAGTLMFFMGEVGCFWHHAHLARLRARPPKDLLRVRMDSQCSSAQPLLQGSMDKAGRIYVLPSGGLFDFVACPHWFCEIVGFGGLSVVAWHLHAVLIPVGMASFLAGKAKSSTRWYKDKFGDKYPSSRRHLVPFIW